MKYAIKVLQNHYKLLIPLVSANADNKEKYSKLRGQQSDILEALSILNGEIRESCKICPYCGRYKRMQGNGIMHQLCECGT